MGEDPPGRERSGEHGRQLKEGEGGGVPGAWSVRLAPRSQRWIPSPLLPRQLPQQQWASGTSAKKGNGKVTDKKELQIKGS